MTVRWSWRPRRSHGDGSGAGAFIPPFRWGRKVKQRGSKVKKVNIKIKGGKIAADFTGFQGKACETLEQKIRPDVLDIEEKELKPEYHFSAALTEQEMESNKW